MQRFEIFDMFANQLSGLWKYSFLQGVLLIAFGILILLFPQILVAMIAAFLVILGVTFLTFAWKGRKFHENYENRLRVEIRDLF